ncbi:transcription-associated protein 1 [Entomophthora muscae]|uniref:Transcription-associated protein 1 n=1 Tax=Entomophthora muscae TaxID=34485 RepID=A0ACC2UQ54_9FUNG|nr:transcription-associated protein 1 [Entomophthora muscae]
MEAVVRELFDSPGTPAFVTQPGIPPIGSPKPSSPTGDPNDVSQKPIPKGMFSFKLLIESPLLLRPFGSSHKDLMQRLASVLLPSALEFLKVQAAPQMEAHQIEQSNGNYFVGVSPNIKNRAAFSDFVVSQIKTLGFIALLNRNNWLNLKPHMGEVFEISLRLLCDCPPDFSSSRREIFASLNYLLCQEIRPHFSQEHQPAADGSNYGLDWRDCSGVS